MRWSTSGRYPRRNSDAINEKGFMFGQRKNNCPTRLLNKNGEFNLSSELHDQNWRFYSDIWNTLIEVKWRWCLLLFALSFSMSWLLFSVIYYCIMVVHGDFARSHDENWKPCLENVHSFASIFMYSLEAQHTIGFGYRYPTEQCPEVIFILGLQSMLGIIIQSLMVGVVFAKMTKPKNRAQTLLFSNNAVIAKRERYLCLSFRIGDMRKYKLANVKINMIMIRKHVTAEGEVSPFYLHEMKTQVDDIKECPLLSWPVIVNHVIDENSPMYKYNESDLSSARFEIIVILDGLISSSGVCTQASTSYLPEEILWGQRFCKLITFQKQNGVFHIDYSKFHTTYRITTPSMSAEELDRIRINMPDIPMIDEEECNDECFKIDNSVLKECLLSKQIP
ncbi:Inward rectifier potassium channel irk-1 [Trichinella papuae]|uniref:Inward rectifier potassium channel irk-1 n=1 Tax=Trichinella papuae TaxID=268474 RepID=A0A0V1NAR9_9BILA|nr:Inward rectifier potassium channel irk-1 [Trichinella papuae]